MKNKWIFLLLYVALIMVITACAPLSDFDQDLIETATDQTTSKAAENLQLTDTPRIVPSNTVAPTNTMRPSPTNTFTPTPTATNTPVYFSGAGDVSICGQTGDDLTAKLLKEEVGSGLYFVAGDSSNENGTLYEYQNCFGPSWGQFLPDMRVVPGNHDYYSDPLENFWIYFDGLAGEPGKGWYSFEHGDWHIVMLNSNCGFVGCGPSSEQLAWLQEDLTQDDSTCSLAIWHHPRFNSGIAGNADWLYTFWDVLYENGVDVVINGHDHHYERMAKINPAGELDPDDGIRSFIVGTGGVSYYGIDQIQPFSEIRITNQFGIIQFTLMEDRYTWRFINVEGEVMDQGEDTCSPATSKTNTGNE